MLGVIVCTHSVLADGLKQAVNMIAGEQENFDTLCFMNGDDLEELSQKMRDCVIKYKEQGIPCCIMVDILSATPFNTALAISMQEDVEVISGVNLPLLLEVLLTRGSIEGNETHEFLTNAMNSVKESMQIINGKAFLSV